MVRDGGDWSKGVRENVIRRYESVNAAKESESSDGGEMKSKRSTVCACWSVNEEEIFRESCDFQFVS